MSVHPGESMGNRVAASTALRSVILTAAAFSSASSAANNAAEELANLRQSWKQAQAAKLRRSSNESRLKDRDPDLSKIQSQNQAAQERADAALAKHRQTRQRLQKSNNQEELNDHTFDLEHSRKETAFAMAKAAEVRTELAASQLELTEERQARRKLNEQSDYLNQLIQKTQGDAANLREELVNARAKLLSEAQEADEAMKASRELAEGLAEARASQQSEAASAANLQHSLATLEANLKTVATKTSTSSATELLLLRREEASRRQVSSLLASALERMVHRAFHAWHSLKAIRLQAEQAQEALLQRKLVESLKQEVLAAREEFREQSRLEETRCEALSQLRASESGCARLKEELHDSRRGSQILREELQLLQSRSSETDKVESLRDELRQARSDCVSELQARCEESERCTELESQLSDLRHQASTAKAEAQEARAAAKRHAEEHAKEATEVASLQLSLAHAADEAARASASLEEVQKNQALAVPSLSAAAHARAMEMAFGRREEAARRVLSTLLASQLESLLRQIMYAWRAAKVSSAQEDALQIKEKQVAKMTTELLKSEATQMLMTRKEEALRHWVATLLSCSAETLMLNTLRAWQSAKALRLREEQLQETQNQQFTTELQTLKNELQEALSEERKLRSLKDEVHEERTKQMSELQKLKDELQDLRSNESKKFKALRDELSDKSACIETLRVELQESKQQIADKASSDLEAQRRQEALAVPSLSAAAHARAMEMAFGRREEAARRVLSTLLASQLESLLRQIMDAWRAAKVSSAQEDALQIKEKQVAKMTTELLKSEATQMLMTRKEEALRHWVATLLSCSAETLMLNTLRAWQSAKAHRLRSESMVTQAEELETARMDLEQLQAQMKKAERSSPEEGLPLQEKEVVKMATELLKCEASQMLMMRKEEVLRRWVASFLASQTELFLLNMLRAWRSISSQ